MEKNLVFLSKLFIIFSLFFPVISFAQTSGGGPFTHSQTLSVTDGSNVCYPYQIKVANNSCVGGVATITAGSGSGISTITDGVNTVTGSTNLTVIGGTVGGTTPNPTLTITGGSSQWTTVNSKDVFLPNNGNVGIGTFRPLQPLDVSGTVHISGNVGIGTLAPQATLDVTGGARIAGNTWYVPCNGNGSIIQTYINNAAAGDTLVLSSCKYFLTTGSGGLTINKQLSIIGQSYDSTAVVVNNNNLTAFTINGNADNSLLQNFFIFTTGTTGATAISIDGSSATTPSTGVFTNVNLEHMHIEGSFYTAVNNKNSIGWFRNVIIEDNGITTGGSNNLYGINVNNADTTQSYNGFLVLDDVRVDMASENTSGTAYGVVNDQTGTPSFNLTTVFEDGGLVQAQNSGGPSYGAAVVGTNVFESIDIYTGNFNGGTADLYAPNTDFIVVWAATLTNNTTSGTVFSNSGTSIYTNSINVQGNNPSNFVSNNVGIGSPSPGQKLDVVGTVRAQGFTQRFLGFIATNGEIPLYSTGGLTNLMSASYHVATDNINSSSGTKIALCNAYNPDETGNGTSSIFTASIEYPRNTLTQIKFSGSSSVTVASGSCTFSDVVNPSTAIPLGQPFWIRTYQTNAAGVVYTTEGSATSNYDWGDFNGGVDQTMNTSYTGSASRNLYKTTAIIGYTRYPSILMIGDSRMAGVNDNITDATGLAGYGRLVGQHYGFANLGIPSTTLALWATNRTNRMLFAPYATHVLSELGINDIRSSVSLSTLKTGIKNFVNNFTVPVYWTTEEPVTTSSDSFVTLSGQTKFAQDSVRVSFNDALRNNAMAGSLWGYVEMADAVESARDSGLWAVNGAVNWPTTDGVHGSSVGNIAMSFANIPIYNNNQTPIQQIGGLVSGSLNVQGGINTIGNIGIGTFSPTALLEVNQGNSSNPTVENLYGNTNGDIQLNIQNLNSGSSASSDYTATANDGTSTTHYSSFGINNSTGAAAPFTNAHAGFLYNIDNELDLGALGSSGIITFNTTGGTSPVEQARIAASGNVGIGSVNPGQKLDVQGTIRASNFTNSSFATASTVCTDASKNLTTSGCSSGSASAAGGTNAVQYNSGSSTFAGSESVFSMNGTNVGIGTNSGTNLLDVRGTTTLSSLQVTSAGNIGVGTRTPGGALVIMGGNVGIGTLNPTVSFCVGTSCQLNVGTTGIFATSAAMTSSSVNGFMDNAASAIIGGNSNSSGNGAIIQGSINGNGHLTERSTSATAPTADYINLLVGNGIEAMRIQDNSGVYNVGIGSLAPVNQLDVFGTVNLSHGLEVTAAGNVGVGSITPGQALDVNGTIRISKLGSTISIIPGTNSCAGTGTLSGGTVTISTTCAPSTYQGIFITDGGGGVLANIGALSIGTVTGATSFVVNSANALDSSNFSWEIHKTS